MCDQQTTETQRYSLAPAPVRQLPTLTTLHLYKNQITDRGTWPLCWLRPLQAC